VDAQCRVTDGWWPVILAADLGERDCSLLRRILAADRDSLLRRAEGGLSALHVGAGKLENGDALRLLLCNGLPHLAEAVDAVAALSVAQTSADPARMNVTPLHSACGSSNWNAALALLAAGARVDIAGHIHGRLQTIAPQQL